MKRDLDTYPRLREADTLDVMVVGRNGREHAIAWELARSDRIGELYVAPGIAGNEPGVTNVPIDGRDDRALVEFAQEKDVDLVVVGSIAALERGLVDKMTAANIPAFGPTKQAMRLESSKPYSKKLMERSGVLTPAFGLFTAEQATAAHEYVDAHPHRLYVKAGGLAGGEGAIPCETPGEAHAAIDAIVGDRMFGKAGDEIVIEEWIDGLSVAFSAFAEGESYQAFPAQGESYKPRYDGDKGPNTGGMGTYAPADWYGQDKVGQAAEEIISPVLAAMSREGNPFRGIIMPEFIETPDGDRYVHEINARFGGPEIQVDVRYMERGRLLDMCVAALTGTLGKTPLAWRPEYSIGVNTAHTGYPEKAENGKRITGIDTANAQEGVKVFFNSVDVVDGDVYTNGSRPLTVTAVCDSLSEARDRVYAALELIDYEGIDYRRDIGLRQM